MAIVILPDAQADLLDLQDYMLERWTPELWLAAEDDIFAQLAQVDSGFITGPVVPLLASVGMTEYRTILSSHHRILYRQTEGNTNGNRVVFIFESCHAKLHRCKVVGCVHFNPFVLKCGNVIFKVN